ncbi:CHAT domain-containing tetratricopeptide repeat protein [Pseudomonas rossensis]|uniref:CHAT domain-containing tetratricopeptide repeat protein n=1 Tax=Pseudomonas rossensis TaxID=2305471 RepID=UPI00325FE0C6
MKLKGLRLRMLLPFIALASTAFALADVEELNQQVELLFNEGKYTDAIDVAHQALAEAEITYGRENLNTARSLNNLAALYMSVGRYDDALPLFKRVLAIREKALGPENPSTATILNNLAELYRKMERYDEALPLYQRALVIREAVFGPEHPNTARILNNLALCYRGMGRNDDALPLYQRALAIGEAADPEHPDTATSQYNLAAMYESMGRYEEALPLYQRALAIQESTYGPQHPKTASILNNLGALYLEMGRYDEALPLYQRALAIQEVSLGPEHLVTLMTLNNLATLYKSIGRYDAALPLFQRSLASREKTLGPEHPDTATSLDNLAELYRVTGHFDEALPLYLRALVIQKKVLGPEHMGTMTTVNNLAALYKSAHRYDLALPLFQQVLAITEKKMGPEHVDTATSLNNLAELYWSMGRYNEALQLLRRAVRIVAVTNINDPKRNHVAIYELASFTANLAAALQEQRKEGALDEAIFYYKLSVNTRQRMRTGTLNFDPTTRETFTKLVGGPYHQLSALLIERGRIAEAERVLLLLKESELTEYLRRNGDSGSTQEGLAWTIEEESYRQDLQKVANEWRDFEHRRLAVMKDVKRGKLSETGPEISELDAQRVQLDTRTRNIMSDSSRRFIDASQRANERRLQVFDYARTELSTKLTELRERGDGGLHTVGLLLLPSERGLTLIVTTEQGAVPLMVKISEAELNTQVKALREAILDRKDYRAPAKILYEKLIAPAEAQLGSEVGIRHWAILPFGNLRAVPFAALMLPDGTHLIEHDSVTVLTADGTGKLEGLETSTRDTWRGVALGASQADSEFGSVALPGIRREICGVIRDKPGVDCRADEGMIGGKRYLDAAFTPEVLQRLLGPDSDGASFMHIATHFKVEKSLLLLGDGSKLTTGQILSWTPRLGKYDLIVLSACDSGVSEGAVESLGGMLRSKGAKAVLATLWPVADVGAAPLMVEFYRQRGEKRVISKAAALREAQLAMLKGNIKDETGTVDMRHPYFWAPYVLMGNWL